MRVLVITHPVPIDIRKFFKVEATDYIIAVDQAVQSLFKQRLKIDLAVGDFDSLKNEGVLHGLKVMRLHTVKDVTDTHQALIEAYKVSDDVILIGGFGGDRIEHFYAHTLHFDQFPNLLMMNEKSILQVKPEGSYRFFKTNDFISFFAYPDAVMTLRGFKYELQHYALKTYDPLGISNEVVNDEAVLEVHRGRVLVFQTKRD